MPGLLDADEGPGWAAAAAPPGPLAAGAAGALALLAAGDGDGAGAVASAAGALAALIGAAGPGGGEEGEWAEDTSEGMPGLADDISSCGTPEGSQAGSDDEDAFGGDVGAGLA
jgi:hypothetical protein